MSRLSAKSLASLALAGALLAGAPDSASARTKLVALPERASLLFNLENPNAALAVEERVLALNRGVNRIDFSWQGVSIDMSSIQIQMLDNPDTTIILNVSYPPNENALVWEISSPAAREERIRIYYLLYGVERSTSYRLTANEEESAALFQAYYSIANNSGEDLKDATIISNWPETYKKTLEAGETRKINVLKLAELPLTKKYLMKFRELSPDAEDKYRPRMYYAFKNVEANGLGNALLPYGKHRIFQKDPQGSTIFVGEDWGKELPVNEEQELLLGVANDVVVKRVTYSTEPFNIRRNGSRRIVSRDENITLRYEIENFKDEPVELTLEEYIEDYWEVKGFSGALGDPKTERKTNEVIRITVQLPVGTEKHVLDFTYTKINQLN
jgi:hypothetical protein